MTARALGCAAHSSAKKALRAEEDAATYRGCWRRRALSAASTIRSRPARAPMRRPAARAVARAAAAAAAAATKVRSFLASLEAFLNSLIKKNNGSSFSASLWSCARIWQMLKRQCTLFDRNKGWISCRSVLWQTRKKKNR